MINDQDIIIYKSGHKKGRRHDYDIYQGNRPTALKKVVNIFNLGYLRLRKKFSSTKIILPNRKKVNQGLSKKKIYDKSHSKKRISIEHTICRLKEYTILTDVFRINWKKYYRILDIVTCLVNYGIMIYIIFKI